MRKPLLWAAALGFVSFFAAPVSAQQAAPAQGAPLPQLVVAPLRAAHDQLVDAHQRLTRA